MRALKWIVFLPIAGFFVSVGEAQPDKKGGFGPKTWDQIVEKGVSYLKSSQSEDGTWSKAANPGVTGVVLTSLFQGGKLTADDPVAAKALKFIESLVDPKEGHIAQTGGKVIQTNYLTTVNLIALKAAGKDQKYGKIIADATAYLKKLQWDEKQEKKPDDLFYGGVGYGPGTRPDLSNTSFFLDALKAAGTPSDDPAFKNAIIFISRCQNLKSEYNQQPWAGKINDGSFIYVLAAGKKGGVQPPEDAPRPGYGSMTFAGVKDLNMCGVPKSDPRLKKGMEWLEKNYTVDLNPGLPNGSGSRGYYYYLTMMAKCLDALGVQEVTDAAGKKHDWRAEITTALGNRQRKDGSWANEIGTWMESNSDLCTAYALLTLSHCQPKGK